MLIDTATDRVFVKYWDDYHPNTESDPKTHQIDVSDQRETHGELLIDVGAKEGSIDGFMGVTVEVNKDPLSRTDNVPCVHIHFDGSNLAFTISKVCDKLIIRPETGVSFTTQQAMIEGCEETLLIVDSYK